MPTDLELFAADGVSVGFFRVAPCGGRGAAFGGDEAIVGGMATTFGVTAGLLAVRPAVGGRVAGVSEREAPGLAIFKER